MPCEERQSLAILLQEFLAEQNEQKQNLIFEKICKISPDPYWSDYIFYSDEFYCSDEKIDVDRVIEKIFKHKPILL